jgi:hypothetical protein
LAGEPDSADQSKSAEDHIAGGDVLTLYIDTPLVWTQAKRLECSLLA